MLRKTIHSISFQDARFGASAAMPPVDLIVTSPPYPMIAMWDQLFKGLNPDIEVALEDEDGDVVFELMHKELDRVWSWCIRVLKPGGILCINIGDATRTLAGRFQLHSNHTRVLAELINSGMTTLPGILWRKPTNSPTKFMGSGMLPPGAYVTLEHEHILVFRKGGKRNFTTPAEKQNRQESAYFWEERNRWFSDVWMDLKGVGQELARSESRKRSGAFPLQLAYRLINMFSVKGDTILDPFIGTGTTTLAAMVAERNSIGIEVDEGFREHIESRINTAPGLSEKVITRRLSQHAQFVVQRNKPLKYSNHYHGIPVVSKQEQNLRFHRIARMGKRDDFSFEVAYE